MSKIEALTQNFISKINKLSHKEKLSPAQVNAMVLFYAIEDGNIMLFVEKTIDPPEENRLYKPFGGHREYFNNKLEKPIVALLRELSEETKNRFNAKIFFRLGKKVSFSLFEDPSKTGNIMAFGYEVDKDFALTLSDSEAKIATVVKITSEEFFNKAYFPSYKQGKDQWIKAIEKRESTISFIERLTHHTRRSINLLNAS